MIGWLIGSAMDLARTIGYVVQAGRARIVSIEWLFPLTGLGATESGIDYGVFGVFAIASTFVSIAPELAGAVLGLCRACLTGCVFSTSQPTVLAYAKGGHECRKGCH